MSSITVFGLSYDAVDAERVARFWGAVLGREVADRASAENAVLVTGDIPTTGPRLAFHRVPEEKAVKNRLHFDLITSDVRAETDRLVALGATPMRTITEGATWTTFTDPEGNEFDLIAG
jgi:predicted enzyme related to lactoylglutathione lyase